LTAFSSSLGKGLSHPHSGYFFFRFDFQVSWSISSMVYLHNIILPSFHYLSPICYYVTWQSATPMVWIPWYYFRHTSFIIKCIKS
jgi:hypothetical protein